MRKYVMVLIGLLSALFIAGCGGNKSSSTTISGVTTEPITSSPTTTYYIKQIDDSQTIYTYNSLSNGNIILTNSSDNKQYTFARIQTVNDANGIYWLVFDTSSYKISRLYLSTPPSNYHPKFMGGSVQGTKLTTVTPTAVFTPWISAGTFNQPASITYDMKNDCYYVADYARHVIRQISSDGLTVTIIAGKLDVSGSYEPPDNTTGAKGTDAYFNSPLGVTTDGENLYVADSGNHTIRRIELTSGNHVVKTIAGVASSSGSADSDTGTSAYFNTPAGITTDGTNLYVADTGNYTIRKIILSTHAVRTIAGSAGNSEKDKEGVYTDARFLQPTRLTTDGSYLYVVDFNTYGSSAIRKVVIATGAVSTLAGGYTTKTFGHLGGITTDGDNLYVGDSSADRTTAYIHTVLISSKQKTNTLTTGTASDNMFPPYGLTTNGTHLYFTNSNDNTINYY